MVHLPDISNIIFEKGLELHHDKSGWLSTCNCHEPVTCELSKIFDGYNLRPIALTINLNPSISHCFLAPVSRGRLLEIEMSELTQIAPFQNKPFTMQNFDLSYTVGAIIHHCHQLAQAYVNVCQKFTSTPLLNREISSPFVFSDQPEPYYEFEALIVATRRFYTTARRPIWTAFGLDHSIPNSFEKTIDRCNKLPLTLRERLINSWNSHGEKLKDYRDCIEHYTQLGDHIPFAFMERLDNNLWTAHLRIPDNPEARSVKNFSYDKALDALTYGWTLTNEVVDLAREIIKQLPNN